MVAFFVTIASPQTSHLVLSIFSSPRWQPATVYSDLNHRYDDETPVDLDDDFHPGAVDGLAEDRIAPQIRRLRMFDDPAVANDVLDIEDVDLSLAHPQLRVRTNFGFALAPEFLDSLVRLFVIRRIRHGNDPQPSRIVIVKGRYVIIDKISRWTNLGARRIGAVDCVPVPTQGREGPPGLTAIFCKMVKGKARPRNGGQFESGPMQLAIVERILK